MYGLKQSAKCWNEKFINCLKLFNLHQTNADACMFTSKDTHEKIILVIYVDDGIIACKNLQRIEKLMLVNVS